MTREERNNKLKHFITCLKCEVSGKPCDVNCSTQYDAGNMGEIIENLEAISKALEQEPYFWEKCPYYEPDIMFDGKDEYDMGKCTYKQEPKTGHWIQTNEFFINQDGKFIYKFICSECKSLSYFRKSNKKAIGANACPNCGAKMKVGE